MSHIRTSFLSFLLVSSLLVPLASAQEGGRPPGSGRGGEGPQGRGFGPGGGEGRMRMMPMPVMQALDADGDGELSAKEIENAAVALKKLDKNKDGKLSQEELRPSFPMGGPGGPGGAPDPSEMVNRLMAFDKDGDGKLSKAELPERISALMDRADTNKDGFLDKTELTAMARRQAQMQQGSGPGGRRGPGGPGGAGGPAPRDGAAPERPEGRPRRPDTQFD